MAHHSCEHFAALESFSSKLADASLPFFVTAALFLELPPPTPDKPTGLNSPTYLSNY